MPRISNLTSSIASNFSQVLPSSENSLISQNITVRDDTSTIKSRKSKKGEKSTKSSRKKLDVKSKRKVHKKGKKEL